MRSSLKALRSLETIKIFCSNENNNTSLCSRSLMTLFFLFFLSLVLLKIIMFLGVKLRKRSKKWQKKLACFLFKKQRRKKQRRDKTLINSQQSSLHTKKKEKNSNHRHSSHHGAEFFLLEQRLVHEDIRADTSQRSRCVRYTLRALSLSFYFSLSRPRRTAGIIIIDAFRRRDYISD